MAQFWYYIFPIYNWNSINFKQYEKPQKDLPVNSEVMKALLEQESQGVQGVAGMAELQEDRQCNSFFWKNNIIAIIYLSYCINIAIILQSYYNNDIAIIF